MLDYKCFIQLFLTLTKLWHIQRDNLGHTIMLKMSTIGRKPCTHTFAKVVDGFVNRCLWQVIRDLLLL